MSNIYKALTLELETIIKKIEKYYLSERIKQGIKAKNGVAIKK